MKKFLIKIAISAYAVLLFGGIGTILREMFNGNSPNFNF